MSQVYYTLVHKKYHCPMWDIDICIEGKYHFIDDKTPHIAKFGSCKCPIIENLKLPAHKQDKTLSLFRFCRIRKECLAETLFPPIIDFTND